MERFDPNGPPDRGKKRGHDSESWPPKRFNDPREIATHDSEIKRDIWIERRALFLNDEHRRLGANRMANHLFVQFLLAYHKFRLTRNQADRFRTWSWLQVFAVWLTQLEEGPNS